MATATFQIFSNGSPLALIEKGRAKKELGDPEGAIAAWVEVVERYGDSDVSDLHNGSSWHW